MLLSEWSGAVSLGIHVQFFKILLKSKQIEDAALVKMCFSALILFEYVKGIHVKLELEQLF